MHNQELTLILDLDDTIIKPFEDYEELKGLNFNMLLVTTGYEKLQKAKINALGIESDFDQIYIDDPLSEPRIYKSGIFKDILAQYQMKAKQFWVIGDNPESEIRAAKELGMNTIQRKKKGVPTSILSDFTIDSFCELNKILK